jgi:phosphoribosylformimino-5-aminoimidazole carboxamide ribonucleotide (ProFAR) isomerase
MISKGFFAGGIRHAGVIIGKALYSGAIALEEALSLAKSS